MVYFIIDGSGEYFWDPDLDNPPPKKILLMFSRVGNNFRKGKTDCGVNLAGELIEQLVSKINTGKIDGSIVFTHSQKRSNYFEVEIDRDEFWDFYYRFNEPTT